MDEEPADPIPRLRLQLAAAQARIAELEKAADVERIFTTSLRKEQFVNQERIDDLTEQAANYAAKWQQSINEVAALRAEVAYHIAMNDAAATYLHVRGWIWDSIVAKYRAEHGDAGIPKFWIDKLDAAIAAQSGSTEGNR